jgi:hypothetical protein
MGQSLSVQLCRLVAPEKLSDRFLASGVLYQKNDSHNLDDQVILVYIFEINKPWFPSSQVLPSILEVINEQHSKLTPDKSLGDQFEDSLRLVNERLNQVSEQGETDWIGNFNGLIMVVSGDQLHFSQTGLCPAYLLQNNRIRQITDGTAVEHEPHPLRTFSNLASGSLAANEHILIANQELFREISLDALRRLMSATSPYQSHLTIAKELKKEKNPAVSSVIIKINELQNSAISEPETVILEEEMQSNLRKFHRRMAPIGLFVKKTSQKAGQLSLTAASQTALVFKHTVIPATGKIIQKGSQQAVNIQKKITHQDDKQVENLVRISNKKASAENNIAEVVEIIPSKKDLDQAANIQPDTLPTIEKPTPPEQPIPIEPTAIPDQPIQTDQPELTIPTQQQNRPISPLQSVKTWFNNPLHVRNTALVLAVLFILMTVGLVVRKKSPNSTSSGGSSDKNSQLLTSAQNLETKIKTEILAKQLTQAATDITTAQTDLQNVQNPSPTQKNQSNSLWNQVTAQADSLSQVARFQTSSNQYSLPGSAAGFITNLPYFYAFNANGNTLLRTGQGNINQVQDSIALPNSTDGLVSLTESNQNGVNGYALTRANKVYQITQTNNDTILNPLTTNSGSFASGNILGTYYGNIYILDNQAGLLWRYIYNGTSYEKGLSIIDINKYNLKGAVSMAIDGSIYILNKNGQVQKYTSGVLQSSFSLKGQPPLLQNLVQPLQIITNENISNIYILDGGLTSSNHSTAKVLVFDKNGNFLNAFAFPDNFTNIQAFDINPGQKLLWVLQGKQISEFALP